MSTVTDTTSHVNLDTALRTLAAQARTRYAGEAARIDRALVIALNGGVTLHADGSALVQSCSNAEVVYHVAHGACDCPDELTYASPGAHARAASARVRERPTGASGGA